MDSFVSKIKEIDEITDCYVITGDADIMMRVVCKDIQAYENLLFRKLSQIKEVERLKTLMTLSIVKSTNRLPIRLEDMDQ